jgi:4-hydroxybutyryl-CoA dehydratase / vinylacetyl-CoA-Delta-isomerase
MDGKAYVASLNDGRAVYSHGQRVSDLASHPDFAPNIERTAEVYDRFDRDPAARDAYFTPPTTVEEMRAHAALHVDSATHTTYSSLMTLLTAADRIADVRPQAAEAVAAYVQLARDNDWRLAECITDAKGDRSKPPSQQEDKDAYLRVVGRRDGGVIIRGAKLHISLAASSHELMVIPTKAMKPGEEDYAIACAVPVNAPGVSIVNVMNAAPPEGSDPRDFPFANQRAVPQGFVIFDDVFVPEERIFLDGEVKQAATFAHSLGLWVRTSSMISMCDGFDVMVGLAQLIAEANGLERVEHIKIKISEMVIHATLLRASLEASMMHAATLESGVLAPNELYTNAGKYHGAANYMVMVRHLLDIAGGSAITAPSMRDLENADIGHLVRKYMGSKQSIDGAYRTRLFHAIHDLTTSAQGGAKYAGVLMGGGGLYAQNIVTRMRYDMERAKRMAFDAMGWSPDED